MILFRDQPGLTLERMGIPSRDPSRRGPIVLGARTAMQQSVIWAASNYHAALESMMPVDVFALVAGMKVSRPTPPVLVNPSTFAEGHPDTISDFLYARRMSLMIWGNCFGEIVSRNTLGLPLVVRLHPTEDVTCKIKDGQIVQYLFGRTAMNPVDVYHAREHLLPGVPVGLSPIAYAMLTLKTSAAAQHFAAEWFAGGAVPGAHLKNTQKILGKGEARSVKAKFKRDVANGDLFVTGSDWTYSAIQAKAAESGFIESQNATAVELCRFMNTPANVIDVATNGSARITYQNITQAALDFSVSRQGPSLKRTDDDLTAWTPSPQFVRLNRDAVLAMDPVARTELMAKRVAARLSWPDEQRHIADQQPIPEEGYTQLARLFGDPSKTPAQKGQA